MESALLNAAVRTKGKSEISRLGIFLKSWDRRHSSAGVTLKEHNLIFFKFSVNSKNLKSHLSMRHPWLPMWGVDAKPVTATLSLKIQNFKLNFCSVRDREGLNDICVSWIFFGVVWCLEHSLGSSLNHIEWFDFLPCGEEPLAILQDVAAEFQIHRISSADEWSWKFFTTVWESTSRH